jgi:Recombinase
VAKAALAAAKARGSKLGNPRLRETARAAACEANKTLADRHADNVRPIIREIQSAGAETLQAVADALNARGVPTARGGRWYAVTVRNVIRRKDPRFRPPMRFSCRDAGQTRGLNLIFRPALKPSLGAELSKLSGAIRLMRGVALRLRV